MKVYVHGSMLVEDYGERLVPAEVTAVHEHGVDLQLEDGAAVERTQEEMDADYVPPKPSTPNDLEARMLAMEQQLASYEAAYAQGVQDA